MSSILDKINDPSDLIKISIKQQKKLAQEIKEKTKNTVSRKRGQRLKIK